MTIDRFQGQYQFLSNFARVPSPPGISLGFLCEQGLEIVSDRYTYVSVEHAYQAAKSFDHNARRHFAMGLDPTLTISSGEAKILGRKLLARKDWEDIKLAVMEGCLRQKFKKVANLARLLDETMDEELIEGNTWGDRYWGTVAGVGENHLGKLLMKIREENRK